MEDFSAFLAAKPAALSVHFVASVIAFACGLYLFAARKGTPLHRVIGRVFVVSICGAAGSGFFVFEIFGTVSPLHLLSGFTLVTVLGGFFVIRRASPRDKAARAGGRVASHVNRMSWCFAALLIAALVEGMRLLPPADQPVALFGLEGDPLIIVVAALFSLACWLTIETYTRHVRLRGSKTATGRKTIA